MTKRMISMMFMALLLLPLQILIAGNDDRPYPDGEPRSVVIENFDNGSVTLESFPGEDNDPDGWELNSYVTYQNSPYSLKLFGNTWKVEVINPVTIDTGDVWQVAAYISSTAEIQGFGLMDDEHVLFYSFAGSEEVNIDEWVAVYQGNFPEDQWNEYQLPVGDDWFSYFGYLPQIEKIVFVNDKDATSVGKVYFDLIADITEDLPVAPQVSISYTGSGVHDTGTGTRAVEVQFYGEVNDPDSDEHDFFWDFGDGETSTEQNPQHTFTVSDDHPYRVMLRVADPTDKWGYASVLINVDAGSSSFPVTLNFTGDIMLARKYEQPGGIIPTQGVNAIFEPSKPWLGDAADITVSNLECTLTTWWQHHPTKPYYFKGSPENVAGLVYAGIDVITLANNHIMDYMLPGMQQTQSVLKENNIIFSGAGASSYEAYLPAFYSKSGVTFAFLAACDRTGQYNNYQPYLNAGYNKPGFANLKKYYIKKQINVVRDIVDLVVMEWHTGSEYSLTVKKSDTLFAGKDRDGDEDYRLMEVAPDTRSREIRHYAIDNGADLVVCHHPHVIQGVEEYHGKVIAHSLGNFAFELDYPETFPTLILNALVNGNGFREFTLTPMYIDDYIPKHAGGELGLHILDYIARRSRDMDTYLWVDRQNIVATIITDTLNMNTVVSHMNTTLSLQQNGGLWESEPFAFDKYGSISAVNTIEPAGDYTFRLGREKIWFGNMEDEGCTLWNLNSGDENYCDTVAFAGQRSIQHRRDAGATSNIVTNFEKRIICRSDTAKYSLYGHIRTRHGKNVTIKVIYYEDREMEFPLGEETVGTQVNGDTPWTFYYKQMTLPAVTKFFDVKLISKVPASGTAYSWFDNVGIIRWDNWGEYTVSETIPTPNDYYFFQVRSPQNQENITVDYSQTDYYGLPVGIEKPDKAVENTNTLTLDRNFPNPFNPGYGSTQISFTVQKAEKVSITVCDIHGRKVRILVDAVFQPGKHHLYWDGKNTSGKPVEPGVYFYILQSDGRKMAGKCVVTRNR